MSDKTELIPAALKAVADAMVVCRGVQRSLDEIRQITKDDRSPVTIADFAAQAIVAHRLAQATDGGGRALHLVGEETSHFLRQDEHAAHLAATLGAAQERWAEATEEMLLDAIDLGAGDPEHPVFWTLDPIDGTKGFLRGQQYCVSLGLIEHGSPTVGILGCPNLSKDFSQPLDEADPVGTIYLAVRGEGVWEYPGDDPDAKPIHIKRLDHAAGEAISLCESVESGHSDQSASARIVSLLGEAVEPVRLDSQCKYAVVARGQADVYLRLPVKKGYVERIWDHAAGSLVANEAGAMVTDIHGHDLDFSHGRGLEKNKGIVCAAPALHGRVLGAIKEEGTFV